MDHRSILRDGSRPSPRTREPSTSMKTLRGRHCFNILIWTLLALLLARWPAAAAMRPDRIKALRQETVDMFYHGFDNYMEIAFPEDEVWHLTTMRHSLPGHRAAVLTVITTTAPSSVLRPADTRRQEPPKRRAQ